MSILILSACSSPNPKTSDHNQVYKIEFINSSELLVDTKPMDKIEFRLVNLVGYPINCSTILYTDNGSTLRKQGKRHGLIYPNTSINSSYIFKMPFGNSSVQIKPDCKK